MLAQAAAMDRIAETCAAREVLPGRRQNTPNNEDSRSARSWAKPAATEIMAQ
jgi:hypothetical protein